MVKISSLETVEEFLPQSFPHLKALKGRTLITSDGNTILGVDDKAGIAEIMQLLKSCRQSRFSWSDQCSIYTG